MSDEEERFVDEAARRGAAAASMRLRDRMVYPSSLSTPPARLEMLSLEPRYPHSPPKRSPPPPKRLLAYH